jgi:cytochrome c551/c552
MIRRRLLLAPAALLLAALFLLAPGCGRKAPETTTEPPVTSPLDTGPRAGEFPVAERLAIKGQELFKAKGCTACHAFGRPLTGPDLRGVSMRRSVRWMENQILHPEIMTKEDPISHGLFAQFALQMPNQGLTPDEARAVIEYFKHKDKEAGQSH